MTSRSMKNRAKRDGNIPKDQSRPACGAVYTPPQNGHTSGAISTVSMPVRKVSGTPRRR
jgi:hypothetical protein